MDRIQKELNHITNLLEVYNSGPEFCEQGIVAEELEIAAERLLGAVMRFRTEMRYRAKIGNARVAAYRRSK